MKKFLNLSAVFLLLLCFAGVAAAQNSDSDETAVPAEKTEEPLNETGKSVDAINANTRNYYSDKIIVTATKTPVPLNETGSSINVITAEEIEQKGKKNVVDLLKDIPGVTVSKSGAFGGLADVRIRGGNTGNTLVLIDGMRINDPANPERSANPVFLTIDNIERIEVIKTPQSSLYGSDAQSIINIITKKGQGPTKVKLNFEAGSFNTFRESLSMSGGNDIVNYSLAITREDSKGISAVENKSVASTSTKKNSDYEKDSFGNTAILSKLNMPLSMGFDYTFSVYYQTAKYDYDDDAEMDNPDKRGSYDTFTFNNVLTQKLFDWWSYKLEYGRTTVVRYYEDTLSDPSSLVSWGSVNQSYYKGAANQFEFKNDFKITDFDLFSLGYNLYTENGSSVYGDYDASGASPYNTPSFEESAKTNSFFAHNHLKLAKFLFHTIGARYDKHSEFGGTYTWDTTLLFIVPVTDTRLKGAYATSFKAPTINQLHNSYDGNRDLDPEKGKHYEVGFEQPLLSEIVKIGLTYFNNKYEDQIKKNKITKKLENISETELKGYEGFIDLRLPLNLALGASYTYTETKNKETGDELIRRPKHKADAVLNWSFFEGANLNIVYNYVGKRYDDDYDYATWTSKVVKLDSYSTIDLKLSYWITQSIQVYGRIENVGNKKYQQVNGYAMPERAFYAGVEGHLI